MKYGIVLKKKEDLNALVKEDVLELFEKLDGVQALPIEFVAKETNFYAIGFITPKAASTFEYDYREAGLSDYIALILDSSRTGKDEHNYSFKDVDIYIG